MRFYDLLEAWGRRLEALRPRARSIAAGAYEPATPREALDAAEFARCHGAHAAAARYFAKGVDESLPEVGSPYIRVRFRAARAAVLAAADDKLDAEQRKGLHERARTWLRQELVRWRKRLSTRKPLGKQKGVTFFEPQLWEWKFHLDFTSVKEARALERLPAPERRAWTTLWKEVDEVLRLGPS